MHRQIFLDCQLVACIAMLLLLTALSAVAGESGEDNVPAVAEESEGENASNPLAKVKNTDLRFQHLDLGDGHMNDFFIEGAFMPLDNLKVKYELHYWETDITGDSESNLESATLKGIYFPTEGAWGDVKYRVAIGLDWIIDLGDQDKGIGSGSDQIAPFAGVAMGIGGVMWIPLMQHFANYNGDDVSQTAFRLIAMKPLPNHMWLKLDAKVPIDWEHDQAVPATAELQLGKSITKNVGLYIDGLVGIGSDRPYDWGVGTGLRFNY